jgi:ribonuclease D
MTEASQSAPTDGGAPPELVDDDDALAEAKALVQRAPWLGLSLELNATRSYRRRICLLQLNVGGRCLAVDPLPFSARRPEPLADLLAALPAGAPAIVHCGEYALMALERELHARFEPVVDLQQAAVLLGMPATGLRSLCAELLEVQLPAPLSLDWLQRPLRPAAVAHALADVEHLGALYQVLMQRIRDADLEDELALASRPPPARPSVTPDTPDPSRFRRMPGASTLEPEGLELLAALVRWRDFKAKELDVPPGRLMTNAQLVELAHAPDRALQRLASMRFHSRLVHADLEALRRVVVLALSAEPGADPAPAQDEQAQPAPRKRKAKKKGPPSPAVKQRLARLKAWRREEAEARGVGLQAVLPGVALEHLAFFPDTPLGEVPSFGRRRGERYADVLKRLLKG